MRESKKSEGGAFKAPPGSYRVKGVLHPEMPNILVFNIRIFLQFIFQICTYTQLKSKKKIKNSTGNSTGSPKIKHIRRKGYCKNLPRLRLVMLHTGRI